MEGDSMKNHNIKHWVVLILSGCLFHFASPLAWGGLDYYLIVTNYTSNLNVTATWDSRGSTCINAVQSFPPIPPGGSTEFTISTEASGLCGSNNSGIVVEDFTVTDNADNVIATASVRIPMLVAD